MVKEETAWRRDAVADLKRQKKLARELWLEERHRDARRRGAGYLRYTDKPSLNIVATVTERALTAGAEWSAITTAIKIVAADPQRSPWTIFDEALAQQSRRDQLLDQAAKLALERGPRPSEGLRPLGRALDQVVRNVKHDGQA